MNRVSRSVAFVAVLMSAVGFAHAASYKETIGLFREAGESGVFFSNCYAYAVFPTVGSGAVGVGGAYGKGRVYVHDKPVATSTLSQISLGFQLGGKAYSQIIFFEDKRALEDFESGKFEFGADASVVAITAGANAQVGTDGVQSGASGGQHNAVTHGNYQTGMATFIIAKGGLMASASIAGQKFTFVPDAPTSGAQ
jgi:lipid-binding SYLF domain-containing protein